MGSKTIFVTVHGIGDQIRNETVQAVATRVFAHAGEFPPLPLGAFHSNDQLKTRGAFFPSPPDSNLDNVGFAEVHWADVTRKLATGGYTLEEAKAWALTLVRRQRMSEQGERPEVDYVLLEMVLKELIQTVAVTERLLSLARAANLGSFDLKRILDQFLGDVQFFTEFKEQRKEILKRFSDVMEAVHEEGEIVLVAHSEGTVVAFMGLLAAASSDPAPPWLRKVRALMTLGSPIDKHLVLWPEIWGDVSKPKSSPDQPILWWNYYDYGDPVGFKLDTAREWLQKRGFIDGSKGSLFAFNDEQDVGFTRYKFPGKAHVDYWDDGEVFGHFLEQTERALKAEQPSATVAEEPPESKLLFVLTSYTMPYLIVFAVLFLSVYGLSKGAQQAGFIATISPRNLFGYTALLVGVTIMARVPRLVRKWWRWLVVGGALAGSALAYDVLVEPKLEFPRLDLGVLLLDPFVVVGAIVVFASLLIGRWRPRWGMKPLVCLGTLSALVLVLLAGGELAGEGLPELAVSPETGTAHAPERTLWPMLVGGAFFLYLWWFAALLFDLVFVWHRNIRHAAH